MGGRDGNGREGNVREGAWSGYLLIVRGWGGKIPGKGIQRVDEILENVHFCVPQDNGVGHLVGGSGGRGGRGEEKK